MSRAALRRRLAGLHVLADDDPRWPRDPVAQAEAACAGGAAVVQLRCKRATDGEALRLAGAVRARTRAAGVLFVVNDRFDLALAAEADGVHLGQEDLPPARLPAAARERLLVGRSTHTLAQARAAAREPRRLRRPRPDLRHRVEGVAVAGARCRARGRGGAGAGAAPPRRDRRHRRRRGRRPRRGRRRGRRRDLRGRRRAATPRPRCADSCAPWRARGERAPRAARRSLRDLRPDRNRVGGVARPPPLPAPRRRLGPRAPAPPRAACSCARRRGGRSSSV